ncbi:IS like-2 transposase [Mycobacterium tuberculosis]|nr:IS like-2 transposase [Mycobacterium tuberculosis]
MARQGFRQRAAAIGDAPNRPKYYRCSPRLGRVSQIFRLLASEDWPVTRVGVISDEFWAVVEPLMPSHEGKPGRRFSDHRLILEGIAWRFRTGSPWRDLPAEFGPWQTVWKRHHRWSLDGTCDEVFAHVAAVFGVDAEVAEDIEKLLSVDSTNVRAHQHSAGACSDTLATGGTVELQEIRR